MGGDPDHVQVLGWSSKYSISHWILCAVYWVSIRETNQVKYTLSKVGKQWKQFQHNISLNRCFIMTNPPKNMFRTDSRFLFVNKKRPHSPKLKYHLKSQMMSSTTHKITLSWTLHSLFKKRCTKWPWRDPPSCASISASPFGDLGQRAVAVKPRQIWGEKVVTWRIILI